MIQKKRAIAILLLLFLGSAAGGYLFFGTSRATMPSEVTQYKAPTELSQGASYEKIDPTEPKTEECPINGEMNGKTQKAKWDKRRVLGVMVENHKEARPQSGISAADVVYEAVAEGGITRFLLVYYCHDAPYIGPVRSARVHFMKMLREYGNYPLYAHVGGANCDEETGSGCGNGAPADALGLITELGWSGYNDMNQFSVPFPVFYRDPDRLPGVATEHTVYSSTAKLWDYARTKRELSNVDDKGVKWDTTFTPWKFQDDASTSDRGATAKISFGFWNSFASDYSVVWAYNKKTNVYTRENSGAPHLDKNTGKPLQAKDVIIVFADESPANDGYDGGHILYDLTGTGDALVFQNGKSITATWKKKDEETRMKWYDEQGKEIALVRGKVFVEILPTGNKVTY